MVSSAMPRYRTAADPAQQFSKIELFEHRVGQQSSEPHHKSGTPASYISEARPGLRHGTQNDGCHIGGYEARTRQKLFCLHLRAPEEVVIRTCCIAGR